MSAEFADTNVILYLLDDGPKADRAEQILGRKARLNREETRLFLAGIQATCQVEDLTLQTHEISRALAERYGYSVYDAMIVSSALLAGCSTLWSEDMQGMLVEGRLRIVNPFNGLD